jgi:hypothetical protein
VGWALTCGAVGEPWPAGKRVLNMQAFSPVVWRAVPSAESSEA